MSEGTFLFFIGCAIVLFVFAFVTGVWALLIMGIFAALDTWFGIDLLVRWKKRK